MRTLILYASSQGMDLAEEFCEMWAKLVVPVTLLPMLIHSILGCCWHHAHRECDFPCMSSSVESHDCHGHRHNHRSAHAQRSGNTEPVIPIPCGHDRPCDDVRCVYIEPEFVRIAMVSDLYEHVAALNFSGIMFRNVAATTPGNLQQTQKVAAALQHCALTQVWVV